MNILKAKCLMIFKNCADKISLWYLGQHSFKRPVTISCPPNVDGPPETSPLGKVLSSPASLQFPPIINTPSQFSSIFISHRFGHRDSSLPGDWCVESSSADDRWFCRHLEADWFLLYTCTTRQLQASLPQGCWNCFWTNKDNEE